MATTTTPDNIYVLESSDPDEPLAWQPAMATSVQNALNSRALQTFRWANATERNAQAGMRHGDLGVQEDTGATYQYDTINGWEQVLPVPPEFDSGWISPALTSGTNIAGNEFGYRKIGKVVYLRGRVTGLSNGDTVVTLPVGFRVESGADNIFRLDSVTGDVTSRINVMPSGVIQFVTGPSGSTSFLPISYVAADA